MAKHPEDQIDEIKYRIAEQKSLMQRGGQLSYESYIDIFEDLSKIMVSIVESPGDYDKIRLTNLLRMGIERGIE